MLEMKPSLRQLMVLSMALVGLPTVSSAASDAQPVIHTMSDFPTLYPAAYKRWRQLLPSKYAGMTWLSRFDQYAGGSAQIRSVNVGGVTMIYGGECERHDCGPNHMELLATADGSRVVALVSLSSRKAVVEIGDPSPVELNCFKVLDGDGSKTKSC